MPVKIRLMRIGARKRPFYRVVAVDERKKRTGQYLELLGTYNPLTTPKEILLKQDRIDDWMSKGAVPSTGFLRIMGKAPQKPARKPKKAQPEPVAAAPAAAAVEEASAESSEAPVEALAEATVEPEAPVETTPVEEVAQTEAVNETPVELEATVEPEAPVETPVEAPSEEKAPEEGSAAE